MKNYIITIYDPIFKQELSGEFEGTTKSEAIESACRFYRVSASDVLNVKEEKSSAARGFDKVKQLITNGQRKAYAQNIAQLY